MDNSWSRQAGRGLLVGPWQQCRNWTERREMGFPETIRASGRYKTTRAIHPGRGDDDETNLRVVERCPPPSLLTAL